MIDSKERRVRIANGGLPHPIAVRNGSPVCERIGAEGLLLGVVAEDLYEKSVEIDVALKEKEKLILYTDGWSEATNPQGVRFEQAALGEAIKRNRSKSGENLVNGLVQDSTRFRQSDAAPEDDLTILALEFNSV